VFGKHVKFRTVPELIGGGQEETRESSPTPRAATARRSISPANFSRRWPTSTCCTSHIAAAHRPSRISSQAIADVMFATCRNSLGQISGGNLIPIAFGSPRQSPMFANLPLISQWLPGYEVVNWFAVFGPRGLPADLTALWNKALRAAVAKSDVRKRLRRERHGHGDRLATEDSRPPSRQTARNVGGDPGHRHARRLNRSLLDSRRAG